MSGRAMVQLASVMDRAPGVGLIQTIPTVINSRTLFARWQQFAASAYGTIAGAGLIWWSGAEATFWGHNAILRVRAFAESCGLPELSGKEPMGGRSEEHTSELQSLMRNSYDVFCLKQKKKRNSKHKTIERTDSNTSMIN